MKKYEVQFPITKIYFINAKAQLSMTHGKYELHNGVSHVIVNSQNQKVY